MSIGTKIRITRGRYTGTTSTVAGTCPFTGRLIIRTTDNLPVWISRKSVKVVA